MKTWKVSPEQGIEGIQSAVGQAVPGDRICLMPGDFKGSKTLSLKSGISIIGAGTAETRLYFNGVPTSIIATLSRIQVYSPTMVRFLLL